MPMTENSFTWQRAVYWAGVAVAYGDAVDLTTVTQQQLQDLIFRGWVTRDATCDADASLGGVIPQD